MLHNLKGALADAGDYDLDATMKTGRLVRSGKDPAPTISADLRDVLRRLIDPNHLVRFGLRIQQERIIAVDRNNRVFMEKADLQRLLPALQGETTPILGNTTPKQLTEGYNEASKSS